MKNADSRRGGVLFGLLITALVAVCLVAVLGIYIGSHINVVRHDHGDSADVSIDLPGGQFSVRAHGRPGAAVAGVPVYPGARPERDDSGGSAVIEWNSDRDGRQKGFAVEASSLVTDDSIDKVADYYRKQLPNWIFESRRNGAFHMELREGGYKRMIEIDDEHGRTHIGVATVGEPASN